MSVPSCTTWEGTAPGTIRRIQAWEARLYSKVELAVADADNFAGRALFRKRNDLIPEMQDTTFNGYIPSSFRRPSCDAITPRTLPWTRKSSKPAGSPAWSSRMS